MFHFLGVVTYLMSLSTAIIVAGGRSSPELLKTTESKVSVITVETDVLRLIHQS